MSSTLMSSKLRSLYLTFFSILIFQLSTLSDMLYSRIKSSIEPTWSFAGGRSHANCSLLAAGMVAAKRDLIWEHHFLFNFIQVVYVCLMGHWAGSRELNNHVLLQGRTKPRKVGWVKEAQIVPSSLKRSHQLPNSLYFSWDMHSWPT